jgi:hypothetical protein
MLLIVANTRYSLVKGERIVRCVITTQLHAVVDGMAAHHMLMLNQSSRRTVNVVLKLPLL